jgi:hypothetical protein
MMTAVASTHPHRRMVPGKAALGNARGAVLLAALVTGSLSLLSPSPACAASRESGALPALATPATHLRQPGRIVWHDLVTPDLAADERFYAGLFGWTFRDVQRGRRAYAVAFADGVAVAGLLERPLPRDGGREPHWLGFISSDDVDASVRSALSHSAQSLSGAHDYAQRGRQVVLKDPQGVAFGILSSTSGDPPDTLAEPGQWIWGALFTHDPENETAFYQDVFGYDVYDLNDVTDEAEPADAQAATAPNAQPQAGRTDSSSAVAGASTDAAEHIELASGGYARATVNSLPAQAAQRPSRWLHFVRVESVWSAAAKAQTLGARVVLPPRDDRQGGRIAVLADPSGALFGVMDWSDSDASSATGAAVTHGAGAAAPAPSGTATLPAPPSAGAP